MQEMNVSKDADSIYSQQLKYIPNNLIIEQSTSKQSNFQAD